MVFPGVQSCTVRGQAFCSTQKGIAFFSLDSALLGEIVDFFFVECCILCSFVGDFATPTVLSPRRKFRSLRSLCAKVIRQTVMYSCSHEVLLWI